MHIARETQSSVHSKLVWTIGHSTLPIEQFLNLLHLHRIELVADVRSYPSSRRCPQFNRGTLSESLRAAGIAYEYMQLLGGRRRAAADSLNTRWRHPSFRGYADYMETDSFALGTLELERAALECRVAYLCAESVWWKCHRSMLSDWMLWRGWTVQHIMPGGRLSRHSYTQPARIECGCLTYREERPAFRQLRLF